MSDLKEWDLPLYRRVLQSLSKGQNAVADKLVEWGNPAAFVPYFLTGGHETADSLERLAQEGIDRPNRYGQDSGNVRTAKDLLTASQLGAYYAPIAMGGKLATKGALSLAKEIPMETGRRDFLKKAGALAGAGALSAATPKLVKGITKLADEPLLGKSLADEAVSMAPTTVNAAASIAGKLGRLTSLQNIGWFPYISEKMLTSSKSIDDVAKLINPEEASSGAITRLQELIETKPDEFWDAIDEVKNVMQNTSVRDAFKARGYTDDEVKELYRISNTNPEDIDNILSSPMDRYTKSRFTDWGAGDSVPKYEDDYISALESSYTKDAKNHGSIIYTDRNGKKLTEDETMMLEDLQGMVNDPDAQYLHQYESNNPHFKDAIEELFSGPMSEL